MNADVAQRTPSSKRPRVLVAAPASVSAPLQAARAVEDPVFTFVDSADEAIEEALARDFELVLLDLGLSGIGAEAVADILRRSGTTGAIAAVGSPASGTLFDLCVARPLSAEAVQGLLRAAAASISGTPLLDDGWIERECADLAAAFGASLPAAAANLEAASAEGHVASLAAQVHALKGCAGAYGFQEVARRCALLEPGLRQGRHDVAEVAALVDALAAASTD